MTSIGIEKAHSTPAPTEPHFDEGAAVGTTYNACAATLNVHVSALSRSLT